MKYLKNFVIPFKGLNTGVHEFDWRIDKKFFEETENSEVHDADINVELIFDKQERMFILQFAIYGDVTVKCDRCLDDLAYAVNINQTVYYKFGNEEMDETEEIIVIPESDFQIDISQQIYEFIVLSLPMRKVHGEDKAGKSMCNPKMLKKMDDLSGKNTTDSRWDKLKNLKLDN